MYKSQRLGCLHLLWLFVKSVEGRKKEKGEEIKGKAIRPFGVEKDKSEEEFQWVRLRTVQSRRTAWVRASKREEENIESKRKLWVIHSEEESSEWKEREFFFIQVVSLRVVISI